MKIELKLKYIIQLLILIGLFSNTVQPQTDKSSNFPDGIHLKVISQKRLSKEEKSDFSDIIIRFRLSNETKQYVYYTVFQENRLFPYTNLYARDIGEEKWKLLSGEGKIPFIGEQDLVLSPGMEIEFNMGELSLKNVERRLSIFVKPEKNSRVVEIFSDIYRPLQ